MASVAPANNDTYTSMELSAEAKKLHSDEAGDSSNATGEPGSCSKYTSALITLRYYIILLVGCPVPFLQSSVPVVGGRTVVELLGAAATVLLGVLLTGNSGRRADYLCAMTILLCMRNNILTLIFGLSFERALFWHKTMAVTATIAVGIHSTKGNSSTGIGIITCMSVAAASYFVRPYWFELFYYVHIACYISILPMIMLHYGAKYFTYACGFWALDLALRYIITQNKVVMSAASLPGDVIRLRYKKATPYKPGQYVFLMIPDVHPAEFHPFSFSSAPEEEFVTLHIRELGDWSRKLGEYVRRRAAEEGSSEVDVTVFVEGPYGTYMLDLDNTKYEVVLLISGGIGVTPLQSVYRSLVHQVVDGRPMRKVLFVWSVKDRAIVDAMQDDYTQQHSAHLPLSFQPQMSASPQVTVDGSVSEGDDAQDVQSNFVFFNEYYLTAVRDAAQFDAAGIRPEVQKWLKFGRPNLVNIFTSVSNLCKEHAHIKRVAVCVCGPQSMVDEVKDLCKKSQLNPSARTIRFDCHSEVFDF